MKKDFLLDQKKRIYSTRFFVNKNFIIKNFFKLKPFQKKLLFK